MVWYDIVLYIVFLTPKFLNTFVNVLTVSLIYILFFRVKKQVASGLCIFRNCVTLDAAELPFSVSINTSQLFVAGSYERHLSSTSDYVNLQLQLNEQFVIF